MDKISNSSIGFGFLLGILLITAFVSAVPQPVTYQGKQYYVVTSTNPSEDTGNEVCAKVGKTCVGYTEPTDAVCRLFNPSASVSSSLSGDRSGVYCNGAPQSGVCSTKSDTCHTCPQCTNTVDCSTSIGGLYREMYVECSSATSCPAKIKSRSTQDFLNEIPGLNSQLKTCPASLPSFPGSSLLIGSGNIVVNIAMNSGSTQSFTITISNRAITGVAKGSGTCQQKISISENEFNTILNSPNPMNALITAFSNKRLNVGGCTLFRKIFGFFVNPIARFILPRVFTQPTPTFTPAPTPRPIPSSTCYIRNLPYKCYLDSLTLDPATMTQGGSFLIRVKPGSSFTFTGGPLQVVAELEGRSGLGFGVYGLRGTSVVDSKTLRVRTDLSLPKGRYLISVFKETGPGGTDEHAETSQVLTIQ